VLSVAAELAGDDLLDRMIRRLPPGYTLLFGRARPAGAAAHPGADIAAEPELVQRPGRRRHVRRPMVASGTLPARDSAESRAGGSSPARAGDHQDDLVTPGRNPAWACSRIRTRDSPNRRRCPRGRPSTLSRLRTRVARAADDLLQLGPPGRVPLDDGLALLVLLDLALLGHQTFILCRSETHRCWSSRVSVLVDDVAQYSGAEESVRGQVGRGRRVLLGEGRKLSPGLVGR
jgi:hypothetical protein